MGDSKIVVDGLYLEGGVNTLQPFAPPPQPSVAAPIISEEDVENLAIPDLRLDLPVVDDDLESLYGSMSDLPLGNCSGLLDSVTSLASLVQAEADHGLPPAHPLAATSAAAERSASLKPDTLSQTWKPRSSVKSKNMNQTSNLSPMLTVPHSDRFADPISARDIGTTLAPTTLPLDHKVVINVGGKRFITFTSTLQKLPDTRLSNPAEMELAYDYHMGEYFFDRNPKFFGYILDFYRTGDLHFSHCLCGPAIGKELEYWGVDESNISACCWRAYKTYEDEQRTLEVLEFALEGDPKKVIEEKFADARNAQRLAKWRMRLWEFLDKPNTSRAAQAWAIFIFILILISIASVCLQTHPSFRVPRTNSNMDLYADDTAIPDNYTLTQNITNPKKLIYYTTTPHVVIEYMDTICVFIFTIELIMRFAASPSKLKYLHSIFNVIDIFCVVPMLVVWVIERVDPLFWETREFFLVITYLSLTSVLRVSRLFKLARHYKGLKILQLAVRSSLRELLLLFLLIFMGMLVFSTLIYFAEFDVQDNFTHIPIGFWWSIVTMTTVGYGDYAPKSGWGYLVGSICAVCGMLATGLPIPIIASNFNHYYNYARFRTKLTQRQVDKDKIDAKTTEQLRMKVLDSRKTGDERTSPPLTNRRNKVSPVDCSQTDVR